VLGFAGVGYCWRTIGFPYASAAKENNIFFFVFGLLSVFL
jgi:hypothetical protein